LARLNSCLFMAGHLKREPQAKVTSGFSSVWLGDPPFDPRPAMRWTGQLHSWMSRFFHDKSEPPYRVLPYDRGGMYFAVLNGKIGGKSAGKPSTT